MKNVKVIKRSKIIIDIIMDKINMAQALEILDLLLQNLNNDEIKKWVNNEIFGYGKEDKLPEYRIINTSIVGTVKVGTLLAQKIPIPFMPKDEEDFRKIEVREGINQIMQFSKAEEQFDSHFLEIPLNVLIINKLAQVQGEVIDATRRLSLYAYTNIIANLKSRLIRIFKELEMEYGNLDEYCIQFKDELKEKTIIENINNIIYNDNSIKIGNDNDIDKAIIGDRNGN